MNRQNAVMNDIVNLAPGNAGVATDEGFKTVVSRRNRRRMEQPTRGTATSSPQEKFKARPSKMWLYVGRADESVEESDVREYVERKCSITDKELLVVKRLSLLGRSRAFQLGIDRCYYKSLLDGSFWPSGIMVRRFNFSRQAVKTQSSSEGKSFLNPPNQHS